MSEQIITVSEGAQEQESAVKEINTGLDQLGTSIQNNSATSEETAAASEEMSAQAADLNSLIKFFKVSGDQSTNPQVESFDEPEPTPVIKSRVETITYSSSSSSVSSFENDPVDY